MHRIQYSGSAPGANSNESTLYDSTEESNNILAYRESARYRLALKHSHLGTLKAYAKSSRTGDWVQFYQKPLPTPAAAIRPHVVSIPISTHNDIKVTWTNGGSAQTTWYVGQALLTAVEDDNARLESIETVLGPVASTSSFAAATTTTHAVYAIPTAWLGRRIRIRSIGTTTWVNFGTSASVEASRSAVVSGSPPAWTGSATIADPIPDAQFLDMLVDPSWTHFSFESVHNGTITIFLSDYEQTDLPD
jgi:hypothetical protein